MNLFRAARAGDADALRRLLAEGADPNAREEGDNATPLHFAAAGGHLECVRVLLDAGADVHGQGDRHGANVIGWAARKGNEAVVDLLLARGARHHIFSAMAMGDRELVRRAVERDRGALSRRRSKLEDEQTPLHAALAPPDGLAGEPDYAMAALLIELGADVNARDGKGRTPLEVAALRGDAEAMRLLRAAGAEPPPPRTGSGVLDAAAIEKSIPMFVVEDVRAVLRWYESIGFTVEDAYEDGGEVTFGRVSMGGAELAFTPGRDPGPRAVSLWLIVRDAAACYEILKARPDVVFREDLYEPFYGGRQFSIGDPSGLTLIFWRP